MLLWLLLFSLEMFIPFPKKNDCVVARVRKPCELRRVNSYCFGCRSCRTQARGLGRGQTWVARLWCCAPSASQLHDRRCSGPLGHGPGARKQASTHDLDGVACSSGLRHGIKRHHMFRVQFVFLLRHHS